MKNIHISTFNCNEFGIKDHATVIKDALSTKYKISESKSIRSGMVNILFENFKYYSFREIKKEHAKGTRFILMLSEFYTLDKRNNLFLNGLIWNAKNRNYLENIYDRFLNLIIIQKYIDGFFVLYDAPKIQNYKKIFLEKPIYSLCKNYNTKKENPTEYDFCFIGTLTKYRLNVLNILKKKFKIKVCERVSSEYKDYILRKSAFNLNIPQDENWKDLSIMRVILALKQGTKTLNILSKNNSNRISNSIIVNISIKNLMLSDTEKIMKLFKKHNSTIENKFHDERKNIKFLKFINNISNNNIKKNTKKLFNLVITFNKFFIYSNGSSFIISSTKKSSSIKLPQKNIKSFTKCSDDNSIIHEDLSIIYDVELDNDKIENGLLKKNYSYTNLYIEKIMIYLSRYPDLYNFVQRFSSNKILRCLLNLK